jgi:hypothetical protein
LVKAIDEEENYNQRSIFFPDLRLKVLKTPAKEELLADKRAWNYTKHYFKEHKIQVLL